MDKAEVVAIAEDDHGGMLLRPADDDIAESDALAGVPDSVAAEAPAESVIDIGIVQRVGDVKASFRESAFSSLSVYNAASHFARSSTDE